MEDEKENKKEIKMKGAVLYSVEDIPAPHLCFLFGLQQAVMVIGSTLSIPFILTPLLCAQGQSDVTSTLLNITIFMCGLATMLQTIFGIRLGIVQGGSHTFIAPIVALMSLDKWKCVEESTDSSSLNGTITDPYDWKDRMREIQGNLMVASVTQLFLGCTGMMGFIIQFIGPLTIAPTISLIGLSLTAVAADFNKLHWGIAFMTMGLIVIFSLYLRNVRLPLVGWTRANGCHVIRYPIFQLLPVILSICITWAFCHIMTVTDTFPNNSTHPNYMARTDARLEVVKNAPWFTWPDPFPFGTPTVSAAGYVGFLAATISTILESIGDYFAAARISGVPPPPAHAVNRGIAIEGLSSIVSGMVGTGHGTTSYSGNIGAIGITKVASRSVFFTAGVIMLVCGVVGKFGAVLTLIPEPIIGGTLTVVFGMVSAVGVSTLKFIDLQSTRNLTILGLSLLMGLMIPQWINNPVNAATLNTGSDNLDQVIKVLLGTAMFVGGLVGFILDNTVPGTVEERGILKWRTSLYSGEQFEGSTAESRKLYEYPYITKYMQRVKCFSFIPISPTFDKEINLTCCKKSREPHEDTVYAYDNEIMVDVNSDKPRDVNASVTPKPEEYTSL